jgi:TfoX N-terminal domain
MPFDETLAKRVRRLLSSDFALVEKRMFGGLAFMVNGHMCCGVVGQNLVVRTGPAAYHKHSLSHKRGPWISPVDQCEALST